MFILNQILRTCCGVPKSLFDVLVSHLEPFKSRFQAFEIDEAATLALLHLRHGDSFNYLHGTVNRVRVERPIKLSTISKTIRKCILIWAGPNPYLKETQKLYLKQNTGDDSQSDNDEDDDAVSAIRRDAKTVAERNARDCYYAGSSFNGLREGPDIGSFFHSYVGWFATDMSVVLDDGTSWFDRCMQQSRTFLRDQVARLDRRPIKVKSSIFREMIYIKYTMALLNF